MSRTFRQKRPAKRIQKDKLTKNGSYRDGVNQYAAGSCSNNGGCPVCEGDRLHKNNKRSPVTEDLKPTPGGY